MDLRRILEKKIQSMGFDLYGISSVELTSHADFYMDWLDNDSHGEMYYLERKDAVDRRFDLKKTLPSVRTAVVVAQNYFQDDSVDHFGDESRAVIARYARGEDYHDIIGKKLKTLHRWIAHRFGKEVRAKAYVDTGPILERELAQRAGMGWFGKNTMLINPRKGSYFFLGVLLMDLDIPANESFSEDHCGSCSSCLDSCPTGALLGRDVNGAPVMDARKCISYLTIEHRGSIPLELRPKMGNRVYGCDICQEVCPWNIKFSAPASEPSLKTRKGLDGPALLDLGKELVKMDEAGFKVAYGKSPINRTKRRGLLRNICVAMGNWGSRECIPVLQQAIDDPEPLVREHAVWAMEKIQSASGD